MLDRQALFHESASLMLFLGWLPLLIVTMIQYR